ncbi:oligopeptide/dipeptide ABC transporter ATP-binding protein [Methylopila capsulata]|uniref:ABC transporter ATP-binding protein n=1 Tax=Methylopila capsulata TaxID=61654 RepID=A0A9W6IWY3_9HYPH|nr:ABC transporter ATP-binding protein [Methylopila capsulata]MBM7853075.1 oligopeptide/dipeptide ABC transporter ATP-binding protein [Methylopila capsulata]GLK57713.1 ABC transporter ATP-binding protein [Methylopila capsulata]
MSTPPELFRLLDVEKAYDVGRKGGLFASGPRRRLAALDGVRLSLKAGESVAIVGESGSGKTTLLRVLLGLTSPTDGRALYREKDITLLQGDDRDRFCREVAMIYQDARGSLNPRMSILDLVAEPLDHHGLCKPSERRDRVAALLSRVGLPPEMMERYTSALSGGQVRRVAIARALASAPAVLVADEAVSGLDVSTQAQLLKLLRDLQREMGVSMLFITHDLGVAAYLCERIAVMYLGRIVETGLTKDVLSAPAHPYTRALLNAAPKFFEPIAEPLGGEIPSPIDLPPGCRFAGRCPEARDDCRARDPELVAGAPNRAFACLHPLIGEPAFA